MTTKNKKFILILGILLMIWFLYNNRPNLYFFSVTNVPDFPISLSSTSCNSGCPNTPQHYSPSIPALYGDYIITTEASMSVRAEGGASNGDRGIANARYSIGSCSDSISATGCGGGSSYYSCAPYPEKEQFSKSSKVMVITSTEDNTLKCYKDGILISTSTLSSGGIGIDYSVSSSMSNRAYGSASLSSSYLTIEDTSSKRFIEYNIYDTFDESILNPNKWTSSGTIDPRFGKVFLNPGTLNMLENMKGRIVHIEYETTGTGSVSLSDNQGNSYTLNLGGQESGVIQLETSPLYPNKMYWFFRGRQVKEVDYSATDKAIFSISGTNVFIDNVGFRVLFQTCELGRNQFLAYETFSGPRTISHYSARKMIQQYCINLPPILKKGTGFEEVPELISVLANGKTYNVASGDTIILPYIYTKTDVETLPCVPGTGQIFDVETNTCRDIRGITFFCSEGQWNSDTHSCDIYPELRYLCEGVLDTGPNGTVCLIHIPSQAICDHPDAAYDDATGKCIRYIPTQSICDHPDAAYDDTTGKCIRYIPSQAICDHPNAIYDDATGKCVRYVPSITNCTSYETYNSQKDACISNPTKLINCTSYETYNSQKDACISNPTKLINCTSYETYNSQKDACVSTPIKLINCPINTAYDSNLDKCIGNGTATFTTVSPQDACKKSGGIWNTRKNVCELQLSTVYTCPSNTKEELISGKKICTSTIEPSPSITIPESKLPLVILILLGALFVYTLFEYGPNRGFFRRGK